MTKPKAKARAKPKKKTTVSDHLASIPVDVQPIVKAARATVKAVAPNAQEIACASSKPKSKSMMWKLVRYAATADGEVFVTIGTFTKHSAMFFARGTELDDEDGLLEGGGKALRYITLRTPKDARGAPVEKILRQALALAASTS